MKHLITKLYTNYLLRRGAGIRTIYEKTKRFYGVRENTGFRRKENGVWKYHYGNEVY